MDIVVFRNQGAHSAGTLGRLAPEAKRVCVSVHACARRGGGLGERRARQHLICILFETDARAALTTPN